MAVKYIGEKDGKVHKGHKGSRTGCGIDTGENPQDWRDVHDRITCDKDGCRR